MTRAQRLLLIIALTVIALYLFVSYSDWAWNKSFTFQQAAPRVLIGWVANTSQSRTITGLTASGVAGNSFDEGIWFAVVLPFCLIAASLYLYLGGRHRTRIEEGRCVNCGYDLRGSKSSWVRCPECGQSPTQPK